MSNAFALPPLPPFNSIPAHIHTVDDYEQQAQKHLAPDVWAYLQGGAMEEHSIHDNRESFQHIKLLPRALQDLRGGHTRCHLLGTTYVHPVFLAPVAYQKLFHPDAETATAQAAHAMQSNMLVSSFASSYLEDIAAHHQGWFQLYWQNSRENTLKLVRQAETHHFKAIVVTVDAPHAGIRDRERRAGFKLPEHISAVNIQAGHQAINVTGQQHVLFDGLMAIAPRWDDIAWLLQQTSLPILLKGILHPADALQAVNIGVQGLIISNHGGRILDTVISPLEALPAIRQLIPAPFPILLDSGIRRGHDIFKALALGASAVLVGRPYIYGLAVAGALGAAHVIRILKEELEVTMALCGTARLDDISSAHILSG